MVRLRVLFAAVLVSAVAASASSAEPSFVIRDYDIGGFSLIRQPTLGRAIAVFGQPSTRDSFGYDMCRVSWPQYGVFMRTFYAPDNPCSPAGRHFETAISSPRWRTSRGLKVHHRLRTLRRLYPRARRWEGRRWALQFRKLAGTPIPSLLAEVRRRRVVFFLVRGPRRGW